MSGHRTSHRTDRRPRGCWTCAAHLATAALAGVAVVALWDGRWWGLLAAASGFLLAALTQVSHLAEHTTAPGPVWPAHGNTRPRN